MKFVNVGGSRVAAVSAALCLTLVGFNAAPSSANLVIPANPGTGTGALGPCQGCNQEQTSGTAVSGSASNNPDGSGSQMDITYGTPNDGTMYSGTLMTQVVNDDGTVTVNTFPIADFGNGEYGGATAYNDSFIPTGGTASITINESNSEGRSFTAGWVIRNYHP